MGRLEGKRAKNSPKWKIKIHPSRAVSQEQCSVLSWFLVHLYIIMISLGVFFHFFKIWIFWTVRGIKGQKTVQNDEKFCRSRSISQELYIIWLWFMVYICKMIISPDIFFHFFKIFIFQVREVNSVCRAPYLRNYTLNDFHLWCTCVKYV